MKRTILFFLFVMVGGCVYPTTHVRTIDERPTIAVKNAPQDAVLFVDGLNMGTAAQFDGKARSLAVETGTHKVEIRTSKGVIFLQRIYLGGGELKTLVVPEVKQER